MLHPAVLTGRRILVIGALVAAALTWPRPAADAKPKPTTTTTATTESTYATGLVTLECKRC